MGISNNLYNLALTLIGGCIATMFVSIFYIKGIIKYALFFRSLEYCINGQGY